MSYSITCECGQKLAVGTHQAGTAIRCHCGQPVRVPTLSELRKTTGVGAYESGIIDTIKRMIAAGELPAGNTCIVSGVKTADTLEVYVQCESKWVIDPNQGAWMMVLLMLLLPVRFVWLSSNDDEPQIAGHDRGVIIPLRVDRDYHAKLQNARSQRWLRSLVCKVPIYAELLEDFPTARIITKPPFEIDEEIM